MSVAEFNARKRARRLAACRHFNGIQHDACTVGVRYDDVGRPHPCIAPFHGEVAPSPTPCASRVLTTEAEVDADDAEVDALFATMRTRAEDGYCIHCGVKVTKYVRVGRCAYTEPCGHRLGQVARDWKPPAVKP